MSRHILARLFFCSIALGVTGCAIPDARCVDDTDCLPLVCVRGGCQVRSPPDDFDPADAGPPVDAGVAFDAGFVDDGRADAGRRR